MRRWLTVLLVVVMLLLCSLSCYAAFGGDNYVWVSEDLNGEYSKIGYFRQDQMFTKISAANSKNNNYFDLALGNKIVSFENDGGLYGELGVNSSNGKLDFFFGAGFIYQSANSEVIALGGPKYYIVNQKMVFEANAFIKILPPITLHLGYDNNSNNLFVGIGLRYQ